MPYINGKFRNGFTKTLEECATREEAQKRLGELLLTHAKPWELWVSKLATADWLLQHGDRGGIRVRKSGYKTKTST